MRYDSLMPRGRLPVTKPTRRPRLDTIPTAFCPYLGPHLGVRRCLQTAFSSGAPNPVWSSQGSSQQGLQPHWSPTSRRHFAKQAANGKPQNAAETLLSLGSIFYDGDEALRKDKLVELRAATKGVDPRFFGHGFRLLYSASSFRDHPINVHVPEIVVLGASNVGKSSILNALIGTSGAARVSQHPGRTTTMNAYGIGPAVKVSRDSIPKGSSAPRHGLIIVDTPGYGFKSQSGWGDTILRYLEKRKMLCGAVLLLSSEKKLQDMDIWMLEVLVEMGTPVLVVLTKADKIGPDWESGCLALAGNVRKVMGDLNGATDRVSGGSRSRGLQLYVTAAGLHMRQSSRPGGAGVQGLRRALLEMAGYNTIGAEPERRDNAAYEGETVPFDDIRWKS